MGSNINDFLVNFVLNSFVKYLINKTVALRLTSYVLSNSISLLLKMIKET